MYLPTPSGIDIQTMAVATLSGLAGTGLLTTRVPSDCDLVELAGNLTDYREGLPESFLAAIHAGTIRCDAKWSQGPDQILVELANAAKASNA